MAAFQQGYQCEFIDSVSEDLYCKKCALVARRLTVAMCCGESFCHDCLVDTDQQDKSCPACGVKNFTTFEQIKLQKKINLLQVYCSVKERGCGWSGPLEQLDAHLDPDLDNCQYVDTKCPLNCPLAVPKNKVEQHVDKECVKRAFTCQYCNFKATYEEVVDTHLTECKYVPLQCPNMCGVTCEREMMEDHQKTCRLEDVACEFKGVGCHNLSTREDQEEHLKQQSHKHLTLTASVAVETKQQLQQKMNKVEEKIEEVRTLNLENKETVETLRNLVQEQDQRMKDQEKTINDQEKKMEDQDKKVEGQQKKIEDQELKLKEQEKKMENQDKRIKDQAKKMEGQHKRMEDQERKLKEQEKKMEDQAKKLENQEKKMEDQQQKLKEQENEVKELKKKQAEQNKKLTEGETERKLEEHQLKQATEHLQQLFQEFVKKSVKHEERLPEISEISPLMGLNQDFKMEKFSEAKAKFQIWKSPAMYTHLYGYKFCVQVTPNVLSVTDHYMLVDLWILSGEFKDTLKWPCTLAFTIELINQCGGENERIIKPKWNINEPSGTGYSTCRLFMMEHSKLNNFLKNDTLSFHISEFKVL